MIDAVAHAVDKFDDLAKEIGIDRVLIKTIRDEYEFL